jgi:hypothetical protein
MCHFWPRSEQKSVSRVNNMNRRTFFAFLLMLVMPKQTKSRYKAQDDFMKWPAKLYFGAAPSSVITFSSHGAKGLPFKGYRYSNDI